MKVRVCQLFVVFQHEFANFSLSCEGRLALFNRLGFYFGINEYTNLKILVSINVCTQLL